MRALGGRGVGVDCGKALMTGPHSGFDDDAPPGRRRPDPGARRRPNVELGMAHEAGEHAGREAARMTGRRDIGIDQHRVAVAAQPAGRRRLRPWRSAPRAGARWSGAKLAGAGEPEPRQGRADRLDVDAVGHDGVVDPQRSGPTRPAPEHDDLVAEQFDAGRGRGAARGNRRQSAPIAASLDARASISPSATAMPSADAARDRPMDFSVSRVAQSAPRACASAIRSGVSSGHLTCTKWTSAGSRCRRRAIARRTPSATASTWREAAEVLRAESLGCGRSRSRALRGRAARRSGGLRRP